MPAAPPAMIFQYTSIHREDGQQVRYASVAVTMVFTLLALAACGSQAPTPVPTSTAAPSPTPPPSPTPTEEPTAPLPTLAPTVKPTALPTPTTTLTPTPTPAAIPTATPTATPAPTLSPTATPTPTAAPPEQCDLGLAAREVVVTEGQKAQAGLEKWADSIFGVLKQGTDYVFFGSRSGPPATIAKTVGTLGNPIARSVQTGIAIQNMKNAYDYAAGGPVYRDPATGNILMFYHAEKWPGGDPKQFWSLYGMAKSTDGGDTWYDLGEIVTPEVPYSDEVPPGTAPHARSVPLPAAPFIIIGDYFYVYAKDRPSYEEPIIFLTVARARVKDVVAAANERNTVVPWFKYYKGDWNEPGLAGRASALVADNAPMRQLDVAYNDYLGKYVAAVSAASGPDRDTVYFMESPDGLTWSNRRVIDEGPFGKNYPTIVGTGDDPKVIGRQFYVYYPVGSPKESENFLVRRLVSCEPGIRAHTALSVELNGSRGAVGTLKESSRAPVAGATVDLLITAIDGPGVFTVYLLSGTVPVGATQAYANLNFLRQTGGTGPVDVALYDVRYLESGDANQRVENGDFSQGLQGWSGRGGDVQLQPSDRGAVNMLYITAAPAESGFRRSTSFPVNPGEAFTATFAARVSASSADAGFFGINFQDASGGLVSREIVVFQPAEVKGTVETNEQGEFRFSLDDLGASSLALEARYDGDNIHWSSYLGKTLAIE